MATKILLSNGSEYELKGMVSKGSTYVNNTYMDSITIPVSGDFEAIQKDFTNQEAVSNISVVDVENGLSSTYSGYQKFIGVTISSENVGKNIYIVTLAMSNDVQQLIKSWQTSMDTMSEKIMSVDEASAEMSNKVNDVKRYVENIVGNTDIDTMTLDEAINFRIKESKKALSEFFNTATIKSSCHGGKEAEYSITSEKQSYLISMIAIADLAAASGVEYQPSWNASGEICTYDWTVDELKQLAFEMETYVRPLVSKQQTIEKSISACKTVAEVKEIEISYSFS